MNVNGGTLIRDGPLENLLGGGGEVQKKYSPKGKLNDGLKKLIRGV